MKDGPGSFGGLEDTNAAATDSDSIRPSVTASTSSLRATTAPVGPPPPELSSGSSGPMYALVSVLTLLIAMLTPTPAASDILSAPVTDQEITSSSARRRRSLAATFALLLIQAYVVELTLDRLNIPFKPMDPPRPLVGPSAMIRSTVLAVTETSLLSSAGCTTVTPSAMYARVVV